MIINLNNREEEIQGEMLSIEDILKHMNFTFPRIIVKLNGALIKKPFYRETMVREGDDLHIIHLISGG